jgi:hypothetical protein
MLSRLPYGVIALLSYPTAYSAHAAAAFKPTSALCVPVLIAILRLELLLLARKIQNQSVRQKSASQFLFFPPCLCIFG